MKYNISRFLLYFISFLLLTACVTRTIVKEPQVSSLEKLQNQLQLLVDDPNLSSAQVGIYIEDLSNGEVIFQKNQYKRFVPASNMKLYTTASALARLGKDYTLKTEFWHDGVIRNNVLEGNLIIRGMGDPAISGRFFDDNILALFDSWKDSLQKKGIHRIQGDIIGDESYFEGRKLGNGWNWDDETYWYSAQINALSFNDNCVDLTITPGDTIGSLLKIQMNPQSDYSQINNTALTVHSDSGSNISILRERAQNIISIAGKLSASADTIRTSITVEDPAKYFLDHFKAVLDTSGIDFIGNCLVENSGADYTKRTKLYTHHSPPMHELIRVVNKGSHNFYADQIFKMLGAEFAGKGTWGNGSEAVKGWLSSIGTAVDELSIFDGSGLSRMNLLTPVATANLLRYMYHHTDFESFYNSLPIAGIDGTIKSRMRDTAAEGNVRAKTGYVRHARSLSGYVHDSKNRPYLFVMMVNHYSVPTRYINTMQDRICVLLSNY